MVLQAVSLRFCVPSENNVIRWGFCSTMLRRNCVLPLCGNRDDSAISDQNWIKNREAAASRFTLPRLNWQINLWMNKKNLCSFALCQFVLSWFFLFKWSAFEKNPSARLGMLSFHVTSQVSRYLDGSFQLSLSPVSDIWKKNSNRILIFRISSWNLFEYLCQSTQRRIWGNAFFCEAYVYLLELHLKLNSQNSFHLYRSLSRF